LRSIIQRKVSDKAIGVGKLQIVINTVAKAKRDAGAQHAGDGKFRHPRR
jgi:hypothetical protein